jgi:hypothetical protein
MQRPFAGVPRMKPSAGLMLAVLALYKGIANRDPNEPPDRWGHPVSDRGDARTV